MRRIRLGAPLSLLIAAGCVAGTYVPGAMHFGIGGSLGSLFLAVDLLTLLTWPFVHADTTHLLGNMMLFSFALANLEKKQGWFEYLCCLAATAVVIGIAQSRVWPRQHGACRCQRLGFHDDSAIHVHVRGSGRRRGSHPHRRLALRVAGGPAALTPNQVSQFAHLLGGACGLVFGLLGSGQHVAKRCPRAACWRSQ